MPEELPGTENVCQMRVKQNFPNAAQRYVKLACDYRNAASLIRNGFLREEDVRMDTLILASTCNFTNRPCAYRCTGRKAMI